MHKPQRPRIHYRRAAGAGSSRNVSAATRTLPPSSPHLASGHCALSVIRTSPLTASTDTLWRKKPGDELLAARSMVYSNE